MIAFSGPPRAPGHSGPTTASRNSRNHIINGKSCQPRRHGPPVSVQRLGRLERGVGRPWGGARPALGSRRGYAGLGRQRRRSSRNAPWASPSRRRSNATKGETLRRTRKESTYATRPPGTRGDGQGARYLDRRRWGRAALAPNPFVQAPDPRSDASTCAHSLAPIQISGRAAISSISSST